MKLISIPADMIAKSIKVVSAPNSDEELFVAMGKFKTLKVVMAINNNSFTIHIGKSEIKKLIANYSDGEKYEGILDYAYGVALQKLFPRGVIVPCAA